MTRRLASDLLFLLAAGFLASCSGEAAETASTAGSKAVAEAAVPKTALEPTQPVAAATSTPELAASTPPVPLNEPGRGGLRLAEGYAETYDLGRIPEGESRETTFEFVSDGAEPLIVYEAKPTCGCTVTELYISSEGEERVPYVFGDPIPVGSQLGLKAKLYTERKRGGLRLQVTLLVNTPERTKSILIEADVVPVFELSEKNARLAFGPMGPEDQLVEVLGVRSRSGEPFRLTNPRLQPGMEIELIPTSPGEDGRSNAWEVAVTVGPGFEGIPGNHSVRLISDLEIPEPRVPLAGGQPSYSDIIMVAEVTGRVTADATFVSFGVIRPGATVVRSVRLSSTDDFHFSADLPVEVRLNPGYDMETAGLMQTTVVPADDGGAELRLELTAPPLEADLSLIGSLKLDVGHPDQESLYLRWSAVVRVGS